MTERIPGTRAARRVEVKYPPPGTGPERQERIAEHEAELRETMRQAALALVEDGIKPTIPAVIDHIVQNGGKLTLPTANRKQGALDDARAKWEEAHGEQPEWHRKPRRKASSDQPTPAQAGDCDPPTLEGGGDVATDGPDYQRLYERARKELAAAEKSRDKLAQERDELREQVRRLELPIIRGD